MQNYPEQWKSNPFGYIVYKRTYSRWIEDEGRRETWRETVQRVVDYSHSLVPVSEEERAEMFDLIFNLRIFPAGRTLWIGGTKASLLYPLANFNCSFIAIDSFQKWAEMFYALMLGVGVGFGALKRYVEKLPRVFPDKIVIHEPYTYHPNGLEHTTHTVQNGALFISVGDSKEGWVESLALFLDAYTVPDINRIHVYYNNVRPAGSRLRTFGGRASGHEALVRMFDAIAAIMNESGGVLRPIHALDISNAIAQAVVVGGVRRSSQICLFDDEEIAGAKVDLYSDPAKATKLYRAQSNNSWLLEDTPDEHWFYDALGKVLTNYEPGFINWAEMKRRRPNANGVNPCSEIILDDRGVCNLTEVNLAAFVKNGAFTSDVYKAVRLATRIGLRQTTVHFHDLPLWDDVQHRDRLLGVSLTGIMDAFAKSSYSWSSFLKALQELRNVAHDAAFSYAHELGLNMPLLVTTIKPSGTISQLAGVSSGIHQPYAPRYLRRMRISRHDPMVRALQRAGFVPRPEGVFEDSYDKLPDSEKRRLLEKASTWVFEFVRTSESKTRAADEPAVVQLQRYVDMQTYWTDHNTSITVQIAENERSAVAAFMHKYWDSIVGVSFSVKDSGQYPLMPYKELDHDVEQPVIDFERFDAEVNRAEREADESSEYAEDTSDCVGGFCPIR